MDNKINLFLDDVRIPKDAFYFTGEKMFLDQPWEIVRSYNEFTRFIEVNGMPEVISFDHDLHPEHYKGFKFLLTGKIPYHKFTHKTGLDCAEWLMLHCAIKNVPLPTCYIHSLNPYGKQNILAALDNNAIPLKGDERLIVGRARPLDFEIEDLTEIK